MSASSNITSRPRIRAITRMSDNVVLLVNFDLVRIIEPIAGGVRLHFGSSPQDRLDAKIASIEGLREEMNP